MPFKKYTLKLKENNNIINQNLPRFSLSYRTKREDPRHVSYDIITALSENSDIIIELDTNFFDNKLNIDGQCFQRFIDAAKSLGLTHSSKEFASTHSYSIFGFRVDSGKKKQTQRFAVYVPHDVWKNESFKDKLPISGARYYITNYPMEAEDIVNKILTMDDKEIRTTFKLIIFDFAFYGQMGIVTDVLNKDDFHRLLGCKNDGC